MGDQESATKFTGKDCGSCLGAILGLIVILSVFITMSTPTDPAIAASISMTATTSARSTAAVLPETMPTLPDNYKAVVRPNLARIALAISQLGITQANQVTNRKLSDSAWPSFVASHVNFIAIATNTLLNMEPPAEIEAIHTQIVAVAEICDTGYHDLKWYIEFRKVEDWRIMDTNLRICALRLPQVQAWVKANPVVSTPAPQPVIIPFTLTLDLTPTPQLSLATANDLANLRSGPSTTASIIGSAIPGQSLVVVARNSAGDWYQLTDGAWIAAFLVDNAPIDLPVTPGDL